MKEKGLLGLACCVMCLAAAGPARSEPAADAPPGTPRAEPAPDPVPDAADLHLPVPRGGAPHGGVSPAHWAAWAREHLDVGTRVTRFTLDDARGTVVGTINRLEEQQSLLPVKAFADVWFGRYAGLQFAWDSVRAETSTAFDGHSDGDFAAGGPVAAVIARWRNRSRVTPYAGVGYAWFGGSFEAATWWELGYATYGDWVSLGRPGTPRNSRRREIAVDDPSGPVYLLGLDVRVKEPWSIDLLVRHAELDLAGRYRITQRGATLDDRGAFTVSLSHTAYGLGVRYGF